MLGDICVWHLQPDVLGSGDDGSSAGPQSTRQSLLSAAAGV